MSDFRVRQYRREALQSRGWLLRDRIRLGSLSPERLALAAYAGDEAARYALGDEAPPDVADLARWVAGLDDWGDEALRRACFAALRFALPLWSARFPADDRPAAAVAAAEAYAGCPCAAHRQTALAGAIGATQAADEARAPARAGEATSLEDEAAARVAATVAVVTDLGGAGAEHYARFATEAAESAGWVVAQDVGDAGSVREAIREALVGWALAR